MSDNPQWPQPQPQPGWPQPPAGYPQPPSYGPGPGPGQPPGPAGVTQPQSWYQPNGPGPAPGPTPRKGSGRGTVLAGVLGGLVVVALVGIGIVAATRNSTSTDTTGGTDRGTVPPPTATKVTVNDRIGKSVTGLELQTGDCVNYDNTGGNITTFDEVACTSPHLAEISAQAEHPAAGGTYPGADALALYSRDRCTSLSSTYLGVDPLDTTLQEFALTPDFNDWAKGTYRVSCMISRYDQTPLTESVKGKGGTYPRGAQVEAGRLKVGDCFDPLSGEAVKIGRNDEVKLTDCNGSHKGYFFGRGVLTDYGAGVAYPGADAVDAAAVKVCDQQFRQAFGVDSTGFVYRYWDPGDASWATDDRRVACAVLDNEGLPAKLDYASYREVAALDGGACFVLPPERTRDTLQLGDRVAVIDCAAGHNGQVIGRGNLTARDTFPGSPAEKREAEAACDRDFLAFVGIASDKSKYGNYTYWYPSETGFKSGDLRYSCALVTDTTSTGSIKGTRA